MTRIALALALLSLLSGCGKPIVLHTMTLQPALVETVTFSRTGEASVSCWPFTCFHSHGTACAVAVAAPDVEVGFSYKYDNGTEPCNCWWYVDCIYRGGVRFDLGALQGKGVVSAQLQWAKRSSCATRLYEGQSWHLEQLTPSNEVSVDLASQPAGAGTLQVGHTVRDWVTGGSTNHGWIFVGSDETYPNHVWKEGSGEIGPPNTGTSKCTGPVGPFQLVVTYTEP